jgi:hypothetical protein
MEGAHEPLAARVERRPAAWAQAQQFFVAQRLRTWILRLGTLPVAD